MKSSCPEMREILSYYAGFIDGEGYIGIKKHHPPKSKEKGFSPTYSERISVAGISEASIFAFNDLMLGCMHFHKPTKLSKRGYWSWEITDSKAREFLTMIYPYLRLKALDAALVLALGKNKKSNNRKRIKPIDLKLREDLYNLLKILHHYHG